ncbi:MAG: gliding motility-associated C-terminal domain-containing protein [Chitinophagales bacterium]
MKLFFCLLSCLISIEMYSVTVAVTGTTNSICYNDGTITVTASSGTPPYTFSIISGPALQGINYPINLATGITLFQAIPAGTFTVHVRDASGATATTTATVGGNYQFPIVTGMVNGNCIQSLATLGRPPYQYAISTVSQSTGFGAYQSNPDFCNLCGGDFWLRVKDSCGNIYTTLKLAVPPSPPSLNVNCLKHQFGTDTILATASGGSGPYSYTYSNGITHLNNSNGVFSFPPSCNPDTIVVRDACNLSTQSFGPCNDFGVNVLSSCDFANIGFFFYGGDGPYTVTGMGHNYTTRNRVIFIDSLPGGTYTFSIHDSCGRTFSYTRSCDFSGNLGVFYPLPFISTGGGSGGGGNPQNPCRTDSSLQITNLSPEWILPMQITCVNCVPQQSFTLTNTTTLPAVVFNHLPPNVGLAIHYTNAFGVDYWDSVRIPLPQINAYTTQLSCNDFKGETLPLGIPGHWDLYRNNSLIQTDTGGHFYNLPNGNYMAVFRSDSAGCPYDTTTFNLPVPIGYCYVPTHNASCQLVYDIFQGGTQFFENWKLVNGANIYYTRFDSTAILFNDIPPGNYQHISDSGCTDALILPPISLPHLSVTSKVNCIGQSRVIATMPTLPSCVSNFGYRFDIRKNGLLLGSNNGGIFLMSDTGWMMVYVYFSQTRNFGLLPTYDSICPIDSARIFVTASTIPFLTANEVKVCGQNAANIPFTIFGGSAPYTLEITGKPNVTLNTNTGIFPNLIPGFYTLIVYDSCGISRSFSVTILDTCNGNCGVNSTFQATPNPVCKGSAVHLTTQISNATVFQWYLNGVPFSMANDTTIRFQQSGSYALKLKAFKGNCIDSSMVSIKVEDSISFSLGPDTFICGNFGRTLQTPYIATHWSTGVTAASIVANSTGWYWAEYSNSCNTLRDSVYLQLRYFPDFDLGNDTVLCDNATIGLHAAVDSASFLWSTGATDSSVIISQQPANPVTVTVSRNGCIVQDSIHITYEKTPAPFSLGPDTFYCQTRSIVLATPTTALWSTGAVSDTIVIQQPGSYWAVISNFCGAAKDSVNIAEEALPSGFSVITDKSGICMSQPDSALVTATVSDGSSVIFSWLQFTDTATVSSHYVYQPDTFLVTVSNGKCPVQQLVSLKLNYCGIECFEKFAVPNALSANSDGKNDTFNIIPLCDIDPFLMRIYNRWGEMVFETRDVHQGWPGEITGTQQEQEVLFYYICMGVAGVKEQKCFTGTVTFLK